LGKIQASNLKLKSERVIEVTADEAKKVLQTQKKLGIKTLEQEIIEREQAATSSEQQG